MNRGEVLWAESPSQKRRPYLVLSRERAIPFLGAVVAVPAIRRIRGIPSEVRLDENDGMPADCALGPRSVTPRTCHQGCSRMPTCCTQTRPSAALVDDWFVGMARGRVPSCPGRGVAWRGERPPSA